MSRNAHAQHPKHGCDAHALVFGQGAVLLTAQPAKQSLEVSRRHIFVFLSITLKFYPNFSHNHAMPFVCF